MVAVEPPAAAPVADDGELLPVARLRKRKGAVINEERVLRFFG
jgi:hypothetical protein